MDREKEQYFKAIQSKLDKELDILEMKEYKVSQHIPLMPLQYKYIHNLKTGMFESVEGVDTILGYKNSEFTLDFYYNLLHPEDLEVTFEMTRKGTEFVVNNQYIYPLSLQLNVFQRLMRKSGEYAYIFRQSTVYHTIGVKLLKTLSVCTDVTELGLKCVKPAQLFIPKGLPFIGDTVFRGNKIKLVGNLTDREKEIVFWVSEGLTSEEVARQLSISKHTVDTHRRNILQKTKMKTLFDVGKNIENL